MSTHQIPNLTGARYLAALAVLVGHLAPFFSPPQWLSPVVQSGGLGVVFFFILSGFVLTRRYRDDFQTSVVGPPFKKYVVRRLARVYPLYLTVLLVYAVVSVNQHGSQSGLFVWVSWWAHALAVQAWLPDVALQQYWNAPGWSISSELFFYAVFPFMLIFFRKLTLAQSVIALLAAAVSVFLVLFFLAGGVFVGQDGLGATWLLRFPLMSLAPFLAGVLLGIHMDTQVLAQQAGGKRRWVTYVWIPTVLIVVFIYASKRYLVLTPYAEVGLGLLVYTPLFVWLTCALACSKNALGGVLGRPTLLLLGQASYALYITHWILLAHVPALVRLMGSAAWAVVVAVVVMTVLSVVIHLLFELPAQVWVNRRFGARAE